MTRVNSIRNISTPRTIPIGLPALTTLAITVSAIGGCGSPEDDSAAAARRRETAASNLILIVVDSLRADHLGSYGYTAPTSRFIDSMAAEGVLVENATANASTCAQSLATLFTGRLPSSGGIAGFREAHPHDGVTTLPQYFKNAGFATGMVTNQPKVRGRGFTKGFDDVSIASQHDPRSGLEVTDQALDVLDHAGGDPFLLYVHYLDPHAPYMPREREYRRFAGAPVSKQVTLPALKAGAAEPELSEDDTRLSELIARYDAEIAYTDHCIERLVRGLRERGLLDDTLIAITSDHGQEFLEHGYVEHGWTLYEEVLRVPLILWRPGALQPARIETPVSLVDVLPTLLALFGIDDGGGVMEGEALFAWETGGPAFRAPAKPRIAELLVRERSIVRAFALDGWKYIAWQSWYAPGDRHAIENRYQNLLAKHAYGPDGAPPLWADVVREELYNLAADPQESRNLESENTDRRDTFRQLLLDYHQYCEEHGLTPRPIRANAGFFQQPGLDAEKQEELEALAYL